MEKEAVDGEPTQDGGHEENQSLHTIQEAVAAAVTTRTETLRTELKRDLLELCKCFREDIKNKWTNSYQKCTEKWRNDW